MENSITAAQLLDTVDLLAELNKSTQHKAQASQPVEQATTEPQEAAKEEKETIEGGETSEDFAEPTETEDHANEVVKDLKKAKLSGRRLAPVILDTCEILLTEGLAFLYERSLDPSDRVAMKELAARYRTHKENKGKSLQLTEDDQRVMEIYLDYEEYCEELPLDEEERESILEPLAELLGDIAIVESPSWSLLLAVFMILLSRLAPLFLHFMKSWGIGVGGT